MLNSKRASDLSTGITSPRISNVVLRRIIKSATQKAKSLVWRREEELGLVEIFHVPHRSKLLARMGTAYRISFRQV